MIVVSAGHELRMSCTKIAVNLRPQPKPINAQTRINAGAKTGQAPFYASTIQTRRVNSFVELATDSEPLFRHCGPERRQNQPILRDRRDRSVNTTRSNDRRNHSGSTNYGRYHSSKTPSTGNKNDSGRIPMPRLQSCRKTGIGGARRFYIQHA